VLESLLSVSSRTNKIVMCIDVYILEIYVFPRSFGFYILLLGGVV
jgi:hypothetical protein